MGAVVVLMTMLVTLLSGLTAGLARESTSAVADLPADHVVFGGDTFAESSITPAAREAWARVPGVESVQALGISTAKAVAGTRTAVVSVFAVEPGGPVPSAPAGRAVLSVGAAEELGVAAGQSVVLNGRSTEVDTASGDASYSHLPVVWTGPAADATVLALTADGTADLAAADQRLGTRTVARADALSSIGSCASENGSLQLMRGMLFAIPALVIGAFFTVWTIQRSADIAVLKALGATTGYLLRDALGQALVLLVAGTAVGAGLAALLGAWAATAVPFVLDVSPALPAVVMTALGLVGAARPPHHLRRPPHRPGEHPMSLCLTDVTLTYPDGDGRLTALDAVSLAVDAGTTTAVVGPSGSGKSSLLAVAATLVTPDSRGCRRSAARPPWWSPTTPPTSTGRTGWSRWWTAGCGSVSPVAPSRAPCQDVALDPRRIRWPHV